MEINEDQDLAPLSTDTKAVTKGKYVVPNIKAGSFK